MTAPDGCQAARPGRGDGAASPACAPPPGPAAIGRARRQVIIETRRADRAGFRHDPATGYLREVLLLEALSDAAPDQETLDAAVAGAIAQKTVLAEEAPATSPISIVGKLALVAIDLARGDPDPGGAGLLHVRLLLNAIAGVAASGGVPLALPARATRPIATQADIDYWAAAERASNAELGPPA